MNRKFLQLLLSFQFVAVHAAYANEASTKEPLALKNGPHLLLDDYLVAKSEGVERKVVKPERLLKEPVVTSGPLHRNWQPFLSVLYDPTAPNDKQFRMWYNVDVVEDPADGRFSGVTAHLTSADGIHWPGPFQKLDSLVADGPFRVNASVLDDGPQHPVPAERYKMMYCDVGERIGPRVAFSPDGLQWTTYNGGNPILPKTPSDDIWTAGYDPVRKRYYLIGKGFGPHTWTNAEGRKLTMPIRRYFTSFSSDFKGWTDPEGMVFSPDEKDSGITQWYGAAGFQVRGDLIFGFLRVLRDDRSPEGAPKEAIDANTTGSGGLGRSLFGDEGGSGMGYTVLTWTRDGVNWQRDRHTDTFLDPDPQVGAWDHAMAWVGTSVPVGDEMYLYYAGYKWGHKYHHSVERQIGLVKVKRDRYVARRSGEKGGTLTTPLVTLDGKQLTLNADAQGGEVRVQVRDTSGQPIPGLSFADCQPVTDDSMNAPLRWKSKSLADVAGKPVRLEFALKNASLFAFELAE
jgi:hypothetical protein